VAGCREDRADAFRDSTEGSAWGCELTAVVEDDNGSISSGGVCKANAESFLVFILNSRRMASCAAYLSACHYLLGHAADPSNPFHLISNHILLLWSNDHSRPNDPHERNNLLGRKLVLVNKVG
jgi:hypothetical protein